LRYQLEVASAVTATRAAGVDNAPQQETLKTLTTMVNEFQRATADLEHVLAHQAAGEVLDHAKHARDKIVPAMNAVRALSDRLETIIADDLWPLPTYREMLFIK
jgi:glutamine synthetase